MEKKKKKYKIRSMGTFKYQIYQFIRFQKVQKQNNN